MTTLGHQLVGELRNAASLHGTLRVGVSPAAEADVVAAEQVGVVLSELRLEVDGLPQTPSAVARWAAEIQRRVGYLLEPLALLETDAETAEALIRSQPPQQNGTERRYYEMRLASTGTASLRRFSGVQGASPRERLDLQLTHEVLARLVDDVVEAAAAVE